MPGRKYLAFDIETAKEFPDGADWRDYCPLGICCAALYQSDRGLLGKWYSRSSRMSTGEPTRQMTQQEVRAMLQVMSRCVAEGYTILTWNGISFDFPVLAEESGSVSDCRQLALNHVDMMFHVFCLRGHYLGLENALRGMGLPGKSPGLRGADAPRLWRRGEYERVLEYVAQDVRATVALAEAVDNRKALVWTSQRGNPQRIDLPSGWLTVREALALPEPNTAWMRDPLTREEFIAWTR